jgi:predicted Zn-dependent protease
VNRTRTSRREFLDLAARLALAAGSLSFSAAWLAGCKEMGQVADIGAALGTATGTITEAQAESLRKSAHAVARTFEDFTPEQEYYIGRTVGAVVLDKYPPWDRAKATRYLNVLGQTLAMASDMPETFGGYHFLVQDSEEINALSAPGGLIFITRGMLRCCRTEDAAAAVLAHEIGHVQSKHGLQAIKKARVTEALTTLGVEGAKTFGGQELAQLTETFENSISDITRTLVVNGYSRGFERQADMAAVTILQRVGYDPQALVDMLQVMGRKLVPGRPDFASTHPAPESRIAEIEGVIGSYRPVLRPPARQRRFEEAMAGV